MTLKNSHLIVGHVTPPTHQQDANQQQKMTMIKRSVKPVVHGHSTVKPIIYGHSTVRPIQGHY